MCTVWCRASPASTAKRPRPAPGSRGRHARTSGEGWAMETNVDEQLKGAVATLNGLIAMTEKLGLRDSAQFLAMAKLHLQLDLNGVSDNEFRALCAALEGKTTTPGSDARARATRERSRRTGEKRAPRRWQCPEDAPTPRGGR